jgi:hypothetical protein
VTARAAAMRIRRVSRGQALVEFAAGAAAFFVLLYGMMQTSLAVYSYNTLAEAAREAVRYAIVHSPTGPNPATTDQIRQVAIAYAPGLALTPGEISVSWPPDPALPWQHDAQVAIAHRYTLQIPFLPAAALAMSATSQMRVAQ